MENYTSDSCDSDSRERRTLDLSGRGLGAAEGDRALEEAETKTGNEIEALVLHDNRLESVPGNVRSFGHLRHLDLSNNRLRRLPDVLSWCPLVALLLNNNRLDEHSLPKRFGRGRAAPLRELNLSGNRLSAVPDQLLRLSSLKYLYLGANNIAALPKEIRNMASLQILALGGNQLTDIPDTVGELKHLQMLVLSENKIEQLPASIGKLNHLRTLLLHKNRLRTLPIEIITLKCLTELSLRDNPLVVRFVKDISLQPPTLLELAARSVKLHSVNLQPGDVPHTLFEYLDNAHHCVNPKCKGVFFDSRVEHIKFVDFCGKYRLPLLQYLCSSKCIQNVGSWESRESDPVSRGYMMKKVLLG